MTVASVTRDTESTRSIQSRLRMHGLCLLTPADVASDGRDVQASGSRAEAGAQTGARGPAALLTGEQTTIVEGSGPALTLAAHPN